MVTLRYDTNDEGSETTRGWMSKTVLEMVSTSVQDTPCGFYLSALIL